MMHTIVGLVAAEIGVRVAIVPSSAAALRLPGAHAARPPSR
jgi:hypothetical protein